MSRAFVKEDVDVPERVGRRRSASGLPPGAVNYMTAAGVQRLRERAGELRDAEEIAELEAVLASATVVEVPSEQLEGIAFGATVTVRAEDGSLETYRIVGVDEVGLEEGSVSWISAEGRALLSASLGNKISIGEQLVTIVKVEY